MPKMRADIIEDCGVILPLTRLKRASWLKVAIPAARALTV